MSYELVNAEKSLGQFASNSGLSDLRKACDGVSLLKDFFDEGYTDKCGEVALALMKVEGPADVVSTAKGLAEMIKDQEVAAISNGVAAEDDEQTTETEPTEKVDVPELSEEVAKSIPDEAGREIFQQALALFPGDPEVRAYIKAYRALEDAGYEHDDQRRQWVHKDSPAVGDVHVDRPIGAINGPSKKKKHKLNDVDKADMITVDVPLFIRLLETVQEEITEDEPLHVMTERITELLEGRQELTMEDYEDIVASIKKRGAAGAGREALVAEDLGATSGPVQKEPGSEPSDEYPPWVAVDFDDLCKVTVVGSF